MLAVLPADDDDDDDAVFQTPSTGQLSFPAVEDYASRRSTSSPVKST